MNNWKTTLSGIGLAVAMFLSQNSTGWAQRIAQAALAASATLLGVSAKDASNKSPY